MTIWQIIVVPLTGALIGYTTNVLAVRMLFWPREAIHFPFFTVQGLLPRRQAQIAEQLGELVARELLLVDELVVRIQTPEMQERIIARVVEAVQSRLYERLPRLVPERVMRLILDTVEKILRQESPAIMENLLHEGKDYLLNEFNISRMVADKINAYNLEELEELIKHLTIKELTFIEILGGVIGFLVGLLQLATLYFLPH